MKIASPLAVSLSLVCLLACGDNTSSSGDTAASGSTSSPAGGGATSSSTTGSGGSGGSQACAVVSGEVVQLQTDDGVTLEADHYTTGVSRSPGVVLLHMIPPNNNRSNYPAAFIDKLLARGLDVLNIDRRGAGNSGGIATEAYTGPNGKLDAKAAVAFLMAHECTTAKGRIGVVGASNGTTSALDYTIFAAADEAVATPARVVFLTGGGYTENQNAIDANGAALGLIPIMFVYSTAESAWSSAFEVGAPAGWLFDEYEPGDHGTSMFNSRPESMDAVATFLSAL